MFFFFPILIIAISVCFASVNGAYYYMQTVSSAVTPGTNFQGIWVDSLGIAYITQPNIRAVLQLTPAGNTSLIIGPSSSSSAGASGPASSVQLDGMDSIVGDTLGNLYISSANYFVWKYDRSSGIVSRFAGALPATLGLSGDGGQATAAQLNRPQGMFLDSNGILFVADSYNDRVRTINTATGIISPFATSVGFYDPISIWGSSDGVIYICDYGNSVIRRFDNTSGIVSNLAGDGNIGFNGDNIPATSAWVDAYAVSGDSNGNIFFPDYTNFRIRVVKDGIISTIAGNGNSGGIIQTLTSANTSIPSPPKGVFADLSGAVYFASDGTVNKLVDIPPTEVPTIAPTNNPTIAPSLRPSSSPTNDLSSGSSNERMSDLHIFYATFFPAFFVLCCMLLGFFCYRKKKNEEKATNNNNEKNGYEMVGVDGKGVVVKKERYYEMWF